MEHEMESLDRNKKWELNLPKGSKAISCRRVVQKDSKQYKASCQRVFSEGGADYNEIFSPVVKHISIRLLLAIVAQGDLELEQFDVKTVILHGELEKRIYMKQSERFVLEGLENIVCLLKKSLYELKKVSQAVVKAIWLIHDQG